MKPVDFFVTETEAFLEELNTITLIPFKFTRTSDIYNEVIEGKGENNEHYAQLKQIDDIKFQINLMLSEFDNGQLFIDKLNNSPKYDISDNTTTLDRLKDVCQLFLNFLNKYRL